MSKRISLTEASRQAPRILARGDSKLLDEGAPPTLSDLAGALQFALGDGRIWLNDDRMVMMQTASLGQLRKEMIDAVGIDQTRRIFRRTGWYQGIHLADVIAKRFQQQDLTAALAAGPRIHTMEGFVKVTTKRFEFDGARGHYHGEFYWHDSTEAVEHLTHFGVCDCPVCWMLIGVPSGYTTRLLGHPVIFREMECTGMGAERCVIVGRNAEAWDDDVPELQEVGLTPVRPRGKPWKPPVDLPAKPAAETPSVIQGRSPAIARAPDGFLPARPLPHRIGRALHGAEMHPGQVFADDAQRQQLRAGEQGDDRSQEGKTRHPTALNQITPQHVHQHQRAEHSEGEAHHASQLQRPDGKAGHHVQGMADQLARRVTGLTELARLVADPHGGEAGGGPSQQHVDVDRWAAVIGENLAQLGAERAQGADVAGGFRAHRPLQGDLGDAGRQIAQKTVLFALRRAVHHVVALLQLGQQLGQLLRRVLEIVVHRHDHRAARCPNPTQQGVVLAVVATHFKATHPRINRC